MTGYDSVNRTSWVGCGRSPETVPT